jgi:hypothetical protein
MSVEQWLETIERLKAGLEAQDLATVISMHVPCGSLADYYGYLLDMAAGYIKDPLQREEQLAVVRGWQQDVEQLDAMLNPTR